MFTGVLKISCSEATLHAIGKISILQKSVKYFLAEIRIHLDKQWSFILKMKQLQFFNHKPSIWYNRNISITLHVLVKKDYHNRKLSYRCFHSLPNIQKVLSANVIQSPIQIFNRIIGTVHSNHHWRCISCSSRCCHHNHIPYRRSSCPKNVVQTGIVPWSVVNTINIELFTTTILDEPVATLAQAVKTHVVETQLLSRRIQSWICRT